MLMMRQGHIKGMKTTKKKKASIDSKSLKLTAYRLLEKDKR